MVELVEQVCRRLGVDDPSLTACRLAARLHDLGKISVPDSILHKPGPLDEGEWEVMRRHPVWTADLLRAVPGLDAVAEIARHHHEQLDGSGYPDGLRGEEIPLGSRIVGACDAYAALRSDRPYRAALGREQALTLVRAGAGSQFDPVVVDALLEVVNDA